MILNEDSSRITQPDNISIKLKNHQLAAIKAMRQLEKKNTIQGENESFVYKTKIGVLGDKVGSGKTLMILGLLALNKKPKKFSEVISVNSQVSIICKSKRYIIRY